ncbi:MAG: D-Ala-D-Ala carboxypeptidase family metallohydrolase [Gemmatimonadales bacterium]
MKALGRRGRSAAIVSIVVLGVTAVTSRASAQIVVKPDIAALAKMATVDSSSLRGVIAHLAGQSGKLLARFIAPAHSMSLPVLSGNFVYTMKAVPAIQEVAGASAIGSFSLITMRSFRDKIEGSVGDYRVGFWPEEKGRLAKSDAYENPEGFIEVTAANQDTRISEHFKLRDFLTHNQNDVWPKYLVLREPLIDKLELVIQDLQDRGIPARNVQVLSGFRTPQYNSAMGDESGRARDSRHQFGDAADIFIDSNNDGRMDDLNRDGRVNYRDARVILAAVERIEQKYPDLIGGTGLYHSTGSHGPFAHIDVRGERARWSNGTRVASRRHARSSRKSTATKKKSPKSRKVATR